MRFAALPWIHWDVVRDYDEGKENEKMILLIGKR